MNKIFDFLAAKPLYYEHIDYTRFPRAYESIKQYFCAPKIIHIIGTNAKGSTGRFLALLLKANGKKVGHFTSPHIFSFNERFWLDGRIISDDELQIAHEKILAYFKKEGAEHFIAELSYFEWSVLLACELFGDCDEFVCEAGLGGEYDATNALAKKLSIFTPLGLDHTAMLGETLEQIAITKLNAMSQKAVISPFFARMDIAKNLAKEKNSALILAEKCVFSKASRIYLKGKSEFLKQNFALALKALKELNYIWNSKILKKIKPFDLKGRCEQIAPKLLIDVGHNEHAALALASHLRGKKVKLIYNCFADKDAKAVLNALKPCLEGILLYEYESKERELKGKNITKIANELGIPCLDFDFSLFQRELKKAQNSKNSVILVFGSFMLVSSFLKEWHEKK